MDDEMPSSSANRGGGGEGGGGGGGGGGESESESEDEDLTAVQRKTAKAEKMWQLEKDRRDKLASKRKGDLKNLREEIGLQCRKKDLFFLVWHASSLVHCTMCSGISCRVRG
jgi:hypothetical protein